MIGARKIADISLPATSNGTGTKQTSVLDPLDLSRCRELELTLLVTAAATAANDSLDVRLQDSPDGGTTWNDRVRFLAVAGNQTASATAPYEQKAAVTNSIALQSAEKVYVASGSPGGTAIPAGTVVNGPFPAPWRKTVTTGTRLSTWRVVFIQTDNSGTASFTAECFIFAHEWRI